VKYNRYRLIVQREGDRVRLINRGGYNWTSRYSWIVESALKKPPQAICHRRRGSDPRRGRHRRLQRAPPRGRRRKLPLHLRKANLERRPEGVFVNPFERCQNA